MSAHLTPVLLESPYGSGDPGIIERNVVYARACMRDCLLRGEAPFASHLLYTQLGVLHDDIPDERDLGVRAGFAWGGKAHYSVVYVDLGISRGMQAGIRDAIVAGRQYHFRSLGVEWKCRCIGVTDVGIARDCGMAFCKFCNRLAGDLPAPGRFGVHCERMPETESPEAGHCGNTTP